VRRSLVFISAVVGASTSLVGPSSAGTPATVEVSPNPVVVGADITITNTDNTASTCEPSETGAEGEPHDGVSVLIITAGNPSTRTFQGTASTDDSGNWQMVTQIADPGRYLVWAGCNVPVSASGQPSTVEATGTFLYDIADLTVTGAEPPAEEPPLAPAPPPEPVRPIDIQPHFTG
jgi:hypothetical protein